jgi:hypothetical protein
MLLEMSEQAIDHQFDFRIKGPVAKIALATGIVLTAITWITTALFTVSSVAAYLGQNGARTLVEEPVRHMVAAVVSPREAKAASPSGQSDIRANEPEPTNSPPPVAAANPAVNVAPESGASPEHPVAIVVHQRHVAEPPVESAMEPAPRAAAYQAAAIEQPVARDDAPAQPAPTEDPCGDGLWGNVCRERRRWTECHPDKWDSAPGCFVQAFDISYSMQ